MRNYIFVVLCIFVVQFAIPQDSYKVVAVGKAGTVSGRVVLVNPGEGIQMEITKDDAICGSRKSSPSVILGKDNGVKDAVIVIEGVERGKQWEQVRAVLDQKGCEYIPHVMVVPAGTQLEIVNSDQVLHNVHAYDAGRELKTLFNIAQPIRGQRTSIRQTRVDKPGVVFASCDAGHPWMAAYVVVVGNPYYAVTDNDGNFEIDKIPPGSYTIRLWHEGIKIASREMERGVVKRYHFEAPYEIVKNVSVAGGASSRINFEIVLH